MMANIDDIENLRERWAALASHFPLSELARAAGLSENTARNALLTSADPRGTTLRGLTAGIAALEQKQRSRVA